MNNIMEYLGHNFIREYNLAMFRNISKAFFRYKKNIKIYLKVFICNRCNIQCYCTKYENYENFYLNYSCTKGLLNSCNEQIIKQLLE